MCKLFTHEDRGIELMSFCVLAMMAGVPPHGQGSPTRVNVHVSNNMSSHQPPRQPSKCKADDCIMNKCKRVQQVQRTPLCASCTHCFSQWHSRPAYTSGSQTTYKLSSSDPISYSLYVCRYVLPVEGQAEGCGQRALCHLDSRTRTGFQLAQGPPGCIVQHTIIRWG